MSPYFSKVYFAMFNATSYGRNSALQTLSYQKTTSDMKVLFHGSNRNGETFYYEEPYEEYFTSATYFIVGEIK